MCDCSDFYKCRHPAAPLIRDTPELLALWCAWRDAVEAMGTKSSPEAKRAYWRLDDAHWLATTPAAGRVH